jgi:hypothetical protein
LPATEIIYLTAKAGSPRCCDEGRQAVRHWRHWENWNDPTSPSASAALKKPFGAAVTPRVALIEGLVRVELSPGHHPTTKQYQPNDRDERHDSDGPFASGDDRSTGMRLHQH